MTKDADWDVVVVGGGPAGMFAAGRAAERGLRVILLEKNNALGNKLLITGGGRCNVTNAISNLHVLTERYGTNGKHLHNLFARFTPEDMREFLRHHGVETREEAEGRVFPVTNSAKSVRDALVRYMEEGNVAIRTGRAVGELVIQRGDPPRLAGVSTTRGEVYRAGQYILATGGTSRPETGSTGEGLQWLTDLKLPMRAADTSLVPLRIRDQWVRELQGLAIGDAALHVEVLPETAAPADVKDAPRWSNSRRVFSRRGKLLFTHFGLSGPLALNSAESIRDLAEGHPRRLRLLVDLLPDYPREELDRRFQAAASAKGKQHLATLLGVLVPRRLVEALCTLAGLQGSTPLAVLSREGRRRLTELLRGAPCEFTGLLGSDKAVVSSGGLDPAAIDFTTMRLRAIPELMVLGDMLDFNRQSGGFSLQVCWASGWVAGNAAADSHGSAGQL